MGCSSSSSSITTYSSPVSTAKVITVDGALREFSHPITVSKALGIDRLSCFLCNADHLQIDGYIPQLDLSTHIEPGQIYFVLPKDNTKCRLTGNDMAALAVKANSALSCSSERNTKRRKKKKYSMPPFTGEVGNVNNEGSNEKMVKFGSAKKVVERILSIIEE